MAMDHVVFVSLIECKVEGEEHNQLMSDNLPFEIIIEILSRLPVRSLLRFRTVSRQWNSIISDHEFAITHAQHASSKVMVLFTSYASTFGGFLPSISQHGNNLFPAWEDSIPFQMPDAIDLRINSLTSCNGLLFIHSFEGSISRLILWNPSTRKYLNLREHQHVSRCFYHAYGLGFDSINNDYKVLEIEIIWKASLARYCSTASVFSMKINSWEEVSDFPYCIDYKGSMGALADGSLHFVGWRIDETSLVHSGIIIAFCLATEETHLVPLPEEVEFISTSTSLTVLDRSLCMVENHSYKECYYLWMMKEYGVRSSWTVLAKIPYSSSIGGRGIFPFARIGDEELLLRANGGQLRLYDLKQNRAMNVIVDTNKSSYLPCLYEETLVCLHSN